MTRPLSDREHRARLALRDRERLLTEQAEADRAAHEQARAEQERRRIEREAEAERHRVEQQRIAEDARRTLATLQKARGARPSSKTAPSKRSKLEGRHTSWVSLSPQNRGAR